MESVSLILILPITFIPLAWLLIWRAGRNLAGMRLENHRAQADRFFRFAGPAWLVMLLALGQQIIDAYPGSREHRAFWFGFIIASDLFLLAFMTNNLVLELRQLREKRQQQAQAKKSGPQHPSRSTSPLLRRRR